MADEFVPELVETLSSEMNPDTVCTVAGKNLNNYFNVCLSFRAPSVRKLTSIPAVASQNFTNKISPLCIRIDENPISTIKH